jgi:tRNA(fMet)-specific endonuclease VapC
MNLLFDTNIILAIVRSKRTYELIEFLNPSKNVINIPVVVEAEVKSIALQNNWGKGKIDKLDFFIDLFTFMEVTKSMINTYVEIDAFSQRKNPSFKEYHFDTPQNMAKNDLWIASTAALLGLELVTTDTDFLHLHNTFLEVRLIDPNDLKKFF